MPDEDQYILNDRLRQTLSPDRLGTYLMAVGFDEAKALKLYIWNAFIGDAFHLPIQAGEVALRNWINCALHNCFGEEWWREREFLALTGHEREADLEAAKRRIHNRNSTLCTGQIVANLSFGFWTGLLAPRYNPQIWSRELRVVFPHLPAGVNRYDLANRAQRVNLLRNRIWHHEPVFKMDILKEFSATMEFVEWICPAKLKFIKPHCRVPALMRLKPR